MLSHSDCVSRVQKPYVNQKLPVLNTADREHFHPCRKLFRTTLLLMKKSRLREAKGLVQDTQQDPGFEKCISRCHVLVLSLVVCCSPLIHLFFVSAARL